MARSAAAVLFVALAVGAAGCGGGEEAVRIGVLTDCQGPFRGLQEIELSGAELPLLHRGLVSRGRRRPTA